MLVRRCRGAGAEVVLVQRCRDAGQMCRCKCRRCRCRGAAEVVQRCRGEMQVQRWWCRSVRVYRYMCSGGGAEVVQRWNRGEELQRC